MDTYAIVLYFDEISNDTFKEIIKNVALARCNPYKEIKVWEIK